MDDFLCSSGTLAASAEVLVTTDVCLKAFEDEDHPALKLSLLVNYDLPAKKVRFMFHALLDCLVQWVVDLHTRVSIMCSLGIGISSDAGHGASMMYARASTFACP